MAKTFEQRFIDELTRQCGGDDIAVLNRTLRENLGWQDARFDKVRTELINKKVIKAAPGQGGKTRFVEFHKAKPEKKAVTAFVSYSHADEALKKELLKHFKPLERLGLIASWHDRMIKPGDNLNEVISAELEKADIIFLLVSIDFINSDYCYDVEMTRAIERHANKAARVVPIILRDCLWKHSPFGGILALPEDGKPIVTWPDQDSAFAKVAAKVHDLIADTLAEK